MKIWIDLDNTPHVPFFIPVKRELELRGHRVVLTTRDAFQVCELADRRGLKHRKVGRHFGRRPLMKVLGLFMRSVQLAPFCFQERPQLAVSHGSRSQIVLSNLLRIPSVLLIDYEHARTLPLAGPRWEIVPEAMSVEGFHCKTERVRRYRGLKEDVYAPEFQPDPALLNELGLRGDDLVVTVRPPANEAHYHNPESEVLLEALMDRICGIAGARAVLLPRNRNQERELRARYPRWFAEAKTIVPARALDGLNLLWFSDLVVSGGGTMNREAAALGVPVYSIFRGKTGAVDRQLEQEGRLTMIRRPEEVHSRIVFQRRDKTRSTRSEPRQALRDILEHIEEIIRVECSDRCRGGHRAGAQDGGRTWQPASAPQSGARGE